MITRALILAAGKGIKVGDHAGPNCLATVGRCTLIERTLEVLDASASRRSASSSGTRARQLRKHVAASSVVRGAFKRKITFFENPAWKGRTACRCSRRARSSRSGRCSSWPIESSRPGLVRELVAAPAAGDRTILCVDRNLARVFDIDDATKVQLAGDRVAQIGKGLRAYQATSAGLFVMSPRSSTALEGLARAVAHGGRAGGRGAGARRRRTTSGAPVAGRRRARDEAARRVAAARLRRRSRAPAMQATPPSTADDTLALIERLLAEKDEPGYVLFSPGPVMTSARVKAALVHHDVCHRDGDYSAVVERLQSKLRPVFGASPAHETLLITGSGTAAMEMAISSAIPPGKKLLVVANGAFGERLEEIAALHGSSGSC